jgi:hypothetical protein
MAKLFIIRGYINWGKTTTFRRLFLELKPSKLISSVVYIAPPETEIDASNVISSSGDYRAIIMNGKTKIGLYSYADEKGDDITDYPSNSEYHLTKLINKEKCDIVICAARTRNRTGSVYNMITKKFPNMIHTEFWLLKEKDNIDQSRVVDEVKFELKSLGIK